MRDEEGIFIGEHRCLFWMGVDRYVMKECCGGRQIKCAYIKCSKKGVVDSNLCTRSVCEVRKEQ